MRPFNLSDDALAEVKAILKHWNPCVEVWAYGSRVDGLSHEGSDLDLVVRNPSNLETPIENFSQIKQLFRDSNLPILFFVLDWARLSPSFRDEIRQQYVVI